MANCCTVGVTDLGCVGFCDTITITGAAASIAGVYTVRIIGTEITTTVTLGVGEVPSFTNVFNESSVIVVRVTGPGTATNALTDAAGNDCFEIIIKPSLILT